MRGGFPEAPAEEFVTGLDQTLERELGELATKEDLERWKQEIVGQVERMMLAQEARQARQMLTWVGVILGAITIATGIIIAVVTLT